MEGCGFQEGGQGKKAAREAARKEATAKCNPGGDDDDDDRDHRGHDPVQVLLKAGARSGWQCTICRMNSSTKERLTARRCRGCPIADWSRTEQDSEDETTEAPVCQHRRMLSVAVLWCSRCGTYADKKTKGLKGSCGGRPPRHMHRGGWRVSSGSSETALIRKLVLSSPLPSNSIRLSCRSER